MSEENVDFIPSINDYRSKEKEKLDYIIHNLMNKKASASLPSILANFESS